MHRDRKRERVSEWVIWLWYGVDIKFICVSSLDDVGCEIAI